MLHGYKSIDICVEGIAVDDEAFGVGAARAVLDAVRGGSPSWKERGPALRVGGKFSRF